MPTPRRRRKHAPVHPARPPDTLTLSLLQRTALRDIAATVPDSAGRHYLSQEATLDYALRLAHAVALAGRAGDFLPTPVSLADLLREMGVEPPEASA